MTDHIVNYADLVNALMDFANTERDMATTEIDGPLWRSTRKANHAAEGDLRRMFLALTAERDRLRAALEWYAENTASLWLSHGANAPVSQVAEDALRER